MSKPNLDDLINAIANNHGVKAPVKNSRRKIRDDREDEDEATAQAEDVAQADAPIQLALNEAGEAASDAPLQLAQAGSGSAAPVVAAPEAGSAEAAATPASAGKTEDDDKGLYWLPLGGLALGGVAIAAGGGGGGGGGAAALAAADNIVTGLIVTGPVIVGHGLTVALYNADGSALLGSGTVDAANGRYSISVGSYSGVVIAKLIDANTGVDYMDEATGATRDITANFMAVGEVVSGTTNVNINALTTIAAAKAGADYNAGIATAISATVVAQTNTAVASAFGLIDLTGSDIITTVDTTGAANASFIPAALTPAMQYGAVLAALSGADAANGGDMQTTVDNLAAGLAVTGSSGTLDSNALDTIMVGARNASATASGSGETSLTAIVSNLTTQTSASVAIDHIANDDVINAGEQITRITGTTVNGASVNLAIGGNVRAATVTGTTWSYTLQAGDIAAMGEGGETISAAATLTGGGTASATRSIVVDTVAPAAAGALAVTGAGAGNATNDTTPTITGTAEAGSTVKLYDGATLLGTTTADGSGNWSITSSTLSEGARTLTVAVTDPAGNTNANAGSLGVTIDTAAPNAPAIGTVASDGTINAAEQTAAIGGTAEANATVALSLGGNTRTVTVDSSGNWSYTLVAADIAAMGQGAETLSATATDAAGNTGAAGTRGISIDTASPTANLTSATDNVGSVTGALTSSATTDDTALVLAGSCEANSAVNVYNGATLLGAATISGTSWSYTATVADGATYQFNAKETDAAGNTSAATSNFTAIGDTAAPNANLTSATDNAGSVTGALTSGATTDDTALVLAGSCCWRLHKCAGIWRNWNKVVCKTTWGQTGPDVRLRVMYKQIRTADRFRCYCWAMA